MGLAEAVCRWIDGTLGSVASNPALTGASSGCLAVRKARRGLVDVPLGRWILVLGSPGAGGVAVALPAHRIFVSQLFFQCSSAVIAELGEVVGLAEAVFSWIDGILGSVWLRIRH